MSFDQVMQAVASIGFPAAMCFYTMHVMQAKIEKLTETVAQLTTVVATLTKKVD